ncbi:molybdopterin-guanine dinucleotide biosynthesis protein B [Ectobacillus ponti]|uniref:Molybdopterin-guanine dinucleotide biosynthesis protein B n=1 Tax=Ectobacillus ponti TaxID=2961894 RepID=A0AA41X6I6_9BACI|nr:molybdopterin-guanine dinucleotide biosynthesis protein B [Ectobacillus ponti]MCP8967534.1 molybdopterin-guanine dinucleotide biosynthesis protein B [Ectobacillus ponti]
MAIKPVILQIAGYQNSGKTTAAVQIVRSLTEAGFRVGTVKHHGHGGKPELPAGKDSTLHYEAGAAAAGVEGDGTFVLTLRGEGLEKWIALYTALEMDVIVIEGYKQADYDKMVCIRTEEDLDLLEKATRVRAVLAWEPLTAEVPVFSVHDAAAYINWVQQYVKEQRYV